MLDWLACLLAPRLPHLLQTPTPELPDPASSPDPADRAAEVLASALAVPWGRGVDVDAFRLLLRLGCANLVTREADQHPGTAGQAPIYEQVGPYAPLEVPLGNGRPTLTGHRSLGAPGAPMVIVVHGLFDSHVSFYVVELAESLRRMGFHVVALDLRDHGGLRGRPPCPTLGLEEGRDLLAAARVLSRGEGNSVGLLGLSYGAHCVVRAAHEATLAGETHLLRGGVMAVCGPLDVHEAVLAFDDPSRLPRPRGLLPRLVFLGLTRTLRSQLRLRLTEAGRRAPSGDEYESYVREVLIPNLPEAPPLVGAFLGRARSAQASVMKQIDVPTLLVHPVDDPLVPVAHLRKGLEAAAGNPMVGGRELPAGGHMGLGSADPEGTLALLAAWFGGLRDG